MKETNHYSVKEEIEHALLKLLTQKSYSDITVTDIVTQAKVARASYYRNFASISDVIDNITDKMAKDFLKDKLLITNTTDERKWREYLFHYFYQTPYRHKTILSMKSENVSLFMQHLHDKIDRLEQDSPTNSIEEKYGQIAKISLIDGISRKWVKDGMKETPEEMVDYVMSLIKLF